jgi:effector-binding domain-containing protein
MRLSMSDPRPTPVPEIRDLGPQPTVCVRVAEPTSRLAELFDQLLPLVAERVADLGGRTAGPPYGRYHAYTQEHVDVEIGIPVVAPVSNLPAAEAAPRGELAASELPGGRAAIVEHRGSYETLNQTYGMLEAWLNEHGEQAGQGPWESYVDDPTEVQDPSQLRTEVIWPLR